MTPEEAFGSEPAHETGYHYCPPELTDAIREEMRHFEKQPLISLIMPVYNVDPKWLKKALGSIEAQWYENWELCIADDKSTNKATIEYLETISNPKIKITRLEENLNISGASNTALQSAKGEYIVLMDNDDEITPDALYEVVKCINSCFKRTLLDEAGHFNPAYDGAQDYELFLRLTEKASNIRHIPKVLSKRH